MHVSVCPRSLYSSLDIRVVDTPLYIRTTPIKVSQVNQLTNLIPVALYPVL